MSLNSAYFTKSHLTENGINVSNKLDQSKSIYLDE